MRTPPPPTFPASLLPTTAAPTTTAAPAATTVIKTSPPGPAACAKSAIRVAIKADARRYAAEAKPRFIVTVTNAGRVACRLDVGPKATSLVVISGKDRIWSSDDCQRGARNEVKLLEPRQSVAKAAAWNRQRSRPGCPGELPAARPGTYVVGASLSGIEPDRKAVFELR
jgi:hypothetical protein